MNGIVLTEEDFASCVSWERYLERVARSRRLQERRYEEARSEVEGAEPFRRKLADHRALILCEEECTDCAWAVPRLAGMLSRVPGLRICLVFREERPDLQDRLLTDGKRAVPKLVIVDGEGRVVGEWGPRPVPIQAYVQESVNVLDRRVWKGEVMRYYREEGAEQLREELAALVRLAQEQTG